jgi:hypothetical protein
VGIDAAFAKQIKLTLLDALQAEGFTRYRKYNVDWPLEKGFHCWVSLNTALYPDRVGLIPLVGVHVEPIERLSHTIQRRKYDRGIATYALNMGKIEAIADERAFAFAPSRVRISSHPKQGASRNSMLAPGWSSRAQAPAMRRCSRCFERGFRALVAFRNV